MKCKAQELKPGYATATAKLFSWSANYDHGSKPAALFLDMIGYSEEELGCKLFTSDYSQALGYLEIGMLADALNEYADRPTDVLEFVRDLIAADMED